MSLTETVINIKSQSQLTSSVKDGGNSPPSSDMAAGEKLHGIKIIFASLTVAGTAPTAINIIGCHCHVKV